MSIQAEIKQESTDRESIEKEFRSQIQGIIDDSYQVEALLRGLQAVSEALLDISPLSDWAPVQITGLSIELERMIRDIGDKAQDAETLFTDHLRGKVAPLYRKASSTIFTADGTKVILTTDHICSKHGIPVVVVKWNHYPGVSRHYLPSALTPFEVTAEDLVRQFLNNEDPGDGAWGERTDEAVQMATVYLWMGNA